MGATDCFDACREVYLEDRRLRCMQVCARGGVWRWTWVMGVVLGILIGIAAVRIHAAAADPAEGAAALHAIVESGNAGILARSVKQSGPERSVPTAEPFLPAATPVGWDWHDSRTRACATPLWLSTAQVCQPPPPDRFYAAR